MTRAIPTAVERLARDLLDGLEEPMAEEVAEWLAASPRFRAFAEAHRTKIRKKLRGATCAEARRDVRSELHVARLLLADRRITLAFEAYGSGKGGPDFTVTFGGERHFNLEVTRLRRVPAATGFMRSHLPKLRQLPPGAPNALLIAVEGQDAAAIDLAAETRALRARADGKDETFFARQGFDGTRGFYQRFLRLGAVFVWCEGAVGDARAAIWINQSARIALSQRSARACLLCLQASL